MRSRTVQNAVAAQEESGIELLRPLLHWSGAQIHALRGDWDAAARHLERGAAASDSYATMLLPYCLAQAQVAETKADYDGVIRALMPVLRMQRNSGIDEPGFWPWQDHYANALVMVGRAEEADAFLVPHEQLAVRRGHRSTLARLAYVRGRIQAAGGDLDAARSTFQGALAQLDSLPMPYARARVKFAYGQSFRRAGKRREAAAILAEARELFAVLGAEAYVDRCSREMRASGVPSGAGGRSLVLPKAGSGTAGNSRSAAGAAGCRWVARPPMAQLTEQERAVADLVAAGMSNKEAAAELYVSVKTVQYHLTRIYAKFHLTSCRPWPRPIRVRQGRRTAVRTGVEGTRPGHSRLSPAMTFHISYPAELPVSERREDLMAAIAANQVTIIAGETGSGKTTQIPKMCLELGLGDNGLIGHTQPRRLAARTVAERIAEELGVEIGQEVGFQVRFTGEVSRSTKVKLMTDGILLAEIQRDKLLRKYNAIIIDEAHERSLNIDFILGYLKRILPQRPDLKIIITSATIDPERFAKHFGTEEDPAPIIEVSGRTFPVEIRYRPLSQPAGGAAEDADASDDELEEDRDPLDAVCDAVDELALEAPGDILIFFSGEREIRTPPRRSTPGSSPTGAWPAPRCCPCSPG